MDFLKILRSFEDFVFEATTWLLFYPRIMWRIIRRPLSTMDYSDREQADSEEKRYDDALSPPLVLLVTIVLTNFIGHALHVAGAESETDVGKLIVDSPENLVLFRSLVFSLVPLIAAATLVRRQGHKLNRESLRAPFYAQCYLAAPCAACVSAGGVILQRSEIPNPVGVAIMAAGGLWFLTVQTRWFGRRLDIALPSAALTAAGALVEALAYLTIILAVTLVPLNLI